jgi:cyclophilin family peptidyl-prolyl cis-trans isomerase
MRELSLITLGALVAVGLVMMSFDNGAAQQKANPVIMMKTSAGDIAIELSPDKAPDTVANFLWYVENKFYDGLIFHRVMSDFMIQGGGFNKDMLKKEGRPSIKNEADNGLSNMRGTIAMARTDDPHSASSQFFINVKDNQGLDFKSKANPAGWGYCVFGKVISGMDTVDKIRQVPVTTKGMYQNVPVEPVIILNAHKATADEIQALKAKKK